MNDLKVFERNMLAIASVQGPACATRLRNAKSAENSGIVLSRTQLPVPFFLIAGRTTYMHSRFDPERDSERIAHEFPKTGFYTFLGLGAGYVISAFLRAGKVTRGLLIEYNAGMLKSILEMVDLTHILGDRKLQLLVDPTPEELESAVSSRYVPALTGDFFIVPLLSRTDMDPGIFQNATNSMMTTIHEVSDDYSVQSFFGKRWFSNIIRNLAISDRPTPPVGPVHEAIITAAGPSLELCQKELRQKTKGCFLIATDTSLRALLSWDIIPDAVISIDCQHISYYHFMSGIPKNCQNGYKAILFFFRASSRQIHRFAFP